MKCLLRYFAFATRRKKYNAQQCTLGEIFSIFMEIEETNEDLDALQFALDVSIYCTNIAKFSLEQIEKDSAALLKCCKSLELGETKRFYIKNIISGGSNLLNVIYSGNYCSQFIGSIHTSLQSHCIIRYQIQRRTLKR